MKRHNKSFLWLVLLLICSCLLYTSRYLATYTFRRDGSSNFGPENRWASFHSFAASWRFSNEKFIQSLSLIHI